MFSRIACLVLISTRLLRLTDWPAELSAWRSSKLLKVPLLSLSNSTKIFCNRINHTWSKFLRIWCFFLGNDGRVWQKQSWLPSEGRQTNTHLPHAQISPHLLELLVAEFSWSVLLVSVKGSIFLKATPTPILPAQQFQGAKKLWKSPNDKCPLCL